MNKEELLDYINKNMFNKNKQWKSTAYFKSIEEDLNRYQLEGNSFQEKIYLFYNGISIPKCKHCGKPTKFIKLSQGFREYCSAKCASNSKEKQAKIKNTVKEKYGVEYITQTDEYKKIVKTKYLDKLKDEEYNNRVVEKRIKTVKEKYGVDNVNQAAEISKKRVDTSYLNFGIKNYNNREKAFKTNIEKYGFIAPSKNLYIKNKIIATNNKKYGANSFLQTNAGKQKLKNTILNTYGVKNVFESEDIKKLINKTNIEKYGVEWYVQSDEFKQKYIAASMEKYGCIHPMKSKILIDEIKKIQFEKFYNYLISSDRLKKMVQPLFDLSNYNGSNNKYLWKCCICNTEFTDSIDDGKIPRCPKCFPKNKMYSNLEKNVANFIKNVTVVDENNREILNGKELDIYLPDYKLAVEFDGLYWHSEINGKDRNYHLNKTFECQKQNIQLLHIFEDEWIDKQEIVKSIIKAKLGFFDNKLYARKCMIKELKNKDVKDFYDNNHIQGYVFSKINLGLFYEDELVSCLSFGKSRYNKKYDWEITRYANKLNTSVVGGFSKLLKYFLANYAGSIITYSDKRLFDGSIYRNSGFTELQPSNPGYSYTDYKNRYSRLEFQKHKLKDKLDSFDPSLTEWENMQLNGWDRIWDCGNYVFELIR